MIFLLVIFSVLRPIPFKNFGENPAGIYGGLCRAAHPWLPANLAWPWAGAYSVRGTCWRPTRKDGTVVHSHTPNAPGTAATATTTPKIATAPTSASQEATTVAPKPSASLHRSKNGRIARSETARRQFKTAHPCPSTGKTSGACPGFVIDHRTALFSPVAEPIHRRTCNGRASAAKEKGQVERTGCASGKVRPAGQLLTRNGCR